MPVMLRGVVWVMVAHASPTLSWTASGDGCPSQAQVEAMMAAQSKAETLAPSLTLRVTVVPLETDWQLDVWTQSESGNHHRTMVVPSCQAAAEATALIAAMASDPQPSASEDTGTGPPVSVAGLLPEPDAPEPVANDLSVVGAMSPTIASDPEPVVETADPPTLSETEGRAIQGAIRARGGATLGFVPIAGMVGGDVGLLVGPWRIWAGFEHAIRSEVLLPGTGSGGEFQLSLGTLQIARAWIFGRIEVGPFLGIGLGALEAQGTGTDVSEVESVTRFWAEGELGAGFVGRIGRRFALGASGELTIPFRTYEFLLRDNHSVWTTASVGARVWGDVEFRFP